MGGNVALFFTGCPLSHISDSAGFTYTSITETISIQSAGDLAKGNINFELFKLYMTQTE